MRALLLLALALAIEEAVTVMKQRPSLRAAGGDGAIQKSLHGWSTRSFPADVHAVFDSTPSPATLDWIAALPGAGTRISWESSLPPLGVGVEPLVDPKRGSRILVAAPPGSEVGLSDSLGVMDGVAVRRVGGTAGPVMVHGAPRATLRGFSAISDQPDSLVIRPILVLGRAGWAGKFLISSLEEYGWKVHARLLVSPGIDVAQGSSAPVIDTARYSAVVVLDSSVARYASEIQQYVRRGGGLVAIGEGVSLNALSAIFPATAGGEIPGGDVATAQPRSGLALRPLALKPGSIPLEKRGNDVAIAARRFGNGRVVQVGYVDSWRWRMGGRGDALEDYRNWLSSVVSSAAYAPPIEKTASGASDPAPLATLYSALDSPSGGARKFGAGDGARWMIILFIIAVSALVFETASRRIGGKP